MTISTSTDEEALQSASALLTPPKPASSPGPTWPGPVWTAWVVLAGGVLVLFLVGLLAGRATGGSDTATPVAHPPGPYLAGEVLDGSVLGDIEGPSELDVPEVDEDEDDDRDPAIRWIADTGASSYGGAWPGQVLDAPEPAVGEAVAWQWETCTPAPDDTTSDNEDQEPVELDCEPVADATDARWESPPTPEPNLVRVVVTVDLGNEVYTRAAAAPLLALAWPDGLAPGASPLEFDNGDDED